MTEEDRLQCAVIEHLNTRGERGIFYFHVPNGGSRHVAEAVKLKRMGTKRGIPDLCLIRKDFLGFLELKTPSGKLSTAQKEVHEELRELGFPVLTAFGLDMALGKLEGMGFLKG